MTSDWSRDNYYGLMSLQIIGQPMAIVALLVSSTAVVSPMEGPVAAAWFNTVKAFSAVAASGTITALTTFRSHFHYSVLANQFGNSPLVATLGNNADLSYWTQQINRQVQVLSAADICRAMSMLAIALILIIPFAAMRVSPPRSLASA